MRVSVGDVSLHVEVEGSGPPLVLLHGGPGADHTLLRPEADILADLARLVYVDQRGSGRSDVSEPARWTWDQWADDIATLCGRLGLHQPILVGVSSGAVVAMACAARHPGLVAGLVLDSPLGVPATLADTLAVFERRGGIAARQAAERYLSGDTSEQAEAQWREHALPLYSHGDKTVMAERLARAKINNDVQTHFRQGGCGPIEGYEPGVPMLILVGADDPVVPTAAARRMAAQRSATLVVVDGRGHGVLRQAPQVAKRAIEEFLRACRPLPGGGPGAAPATTDGAAARPA